MLILGLDSSTEAAALGLYKEGEGILGEGLYRLPLTHSQRLMPEVDRLLKGCLVEIQDIQGIIVTRGPGSFTGIRIGMATAKGLAQALSLPICGISTLRLLAHNLRLSHDLLLPIMDAKGGRIYAAALRWEGDDLISVMDEGLYTPASYLETLAKEGITQGILFGDGYLKYGEAFSDTRFQFTLLDEDLPLHTPRGGTLARIGYYLLSRGQSTHIDQLRPNYLKASQAEIALQRRQTSP